MAIKPKSRAHEERIKVLENNAIWDEAMRRGMRDDLMDLSIRVLALENPRPWYKRIFGL